MAEPHEHQFKVKFSQHHAEEYTVYCDQPCRVLEAIKTLDIYEEKVNCADEKIIIQMGKGDNECSIATHFPCTCIEDNEVLTISCTSEIVEEVQPDFKRSENICTKDRYSIFYIDKVGGKDTKSKDLFRNNAVKQFRYLCVYGEKGITVEDALNRDGRFIDDLGYFKLSENENTITECTQKVNKMDNKKFKICLQRQKNKNAYSSIIKVAQQKGKHVKKKETNGDADTNEIDELLRKQFPDLKRWMESDGDLYKQALNLRKENFQQSFSEVHRVRKLLELGKSVCKVVVKDVSVGTGFVLFDTFILTSTHYFKGSVHENKLKENVDVFAIFDYEDPETETNFYYFRAKDTFIDFDADLDYAVLELNPEGSKPNQQTRAQNIKVPPGLISKFGSLPDNGEACVIGHPAGRVKQMNPTGIIKPTAHNTEQAADKKLRDLFIIQPISDYDRKKDIENILYHANTPEMESRTDIYHGASGSPVFDGSGRVFGLHIAEFTYDSTENESVIKYARPLDKIFQNFVSNLNNSGNKELLKKVEKEAERNELLTKVFNTKQEAPEEQTEVSPSD